MEETVSKYAVFCTKFLRCAIETLKNVKANQKGLFEVTDALKLGKMKHMNIFSCCLGVRSFLSSQNKLNAYSENGASCKTSLMKMSFIYNAKE